MIQADLDVTVNKEQYLMTTKKLRARNFSNNLPFLILSDKLPEGRVYREFADGRIEHQQLFAVGTKFESKVLGVLSSSQAEQIRKEYGLF